MTGQPNRPPETAAPDLDAIRKRNETRSASSNAQARWKFYYRQLPFTKKKKTFRRIMWKFRREAALERALSAAVRRAEAADDLVSVLTSESEESSEIIGELRGVIDQSLSDVQGILGMVDDQTVIETLHHLADQLAAVLPDSADKISAMTLTEFKAKYLPNIPIGELRSILPASLRGGADESEAG